MYLVIDTETTGVVHRTKPMTHSSQPHLIQLAVLVLDHDLVERATLSTYTLAPRRSSSGVTDTRTTERDTLCATYGVPLGEVLPMLHQLAARCRYTVGHNIDHDMQVLNIAHLRTPGTATQLEGSLISEMPRLCTMRAAAPLIALPHFATNGAVLRSVKFPSLAETCAHLRIPLDTPHEALCDARATAQVLRELRARKLL